MAEHKSPQPQQGNPAVPQHDNNSDSTMHSDTTIIYV